jgi:nucleoside 2-deoxyribosyltransferase
VKSVVICGSRRFTEEIRRFAKGLKKAGVVTHEPFLNKNRGIDSLEPDLKKFAFLGLTLHHFSLIKKADVVYIYNKDGYMGVSSTLELGFAEALGKPIYALSDKDPESARKVLFNNIIKTPRELVKILK